MRDDDRVRILHMIEAADAVAQFVAGRSRDDLEQDPPQVPWAAIVAMRNRLIHGYFDINTTIVWKTATVEVPELLPLLRAMVDTTT